MNRQAISAAGVYLLIGSLWIAFSDRLLALMVSDAARITTYQTYKGWAFVAVMSALAYLLIARISRQVDALKESEALLAESELRFREMATHIEQIFFLADPDYGRFHYVSPAYERLWGRSVASLMADPTSWLDGVLPEDRERVMRTIAAGRNRGHYEESYRIQRPDGSVIWVHARAYELSDEYGNAYRVAGIIDDITAQRRDEDEIRSLTRTLEARVAERTADLEHANRELEAFSYSVSHDLRSPLRALNGFAQLVRDDPNSELSLEARQMLQRVSANAEKMGVLIDEILAFSRIGRAEMARAPVQMSHLVAEVAAELAPEYPRAAVSVATLPDTNGDATMLRQAWINLIGNALKFSSKRDVPRIEVGAQSGPAQATTYFVRDNGAGFDMAHAKRLFGVFERLHRADDFPGTGAGLAIAKRIVERHGGRIWAEAEPNRGATFYFELPG